MMVDDEKLRINKKVTDETPADDDDRFKVMTIYTST